jgi:hypothetical protein
MVAAVFLLFPPHIVCDPCRSSFLLTKQAVPSATPHHHGSFENLKSESDFGIVYCKVA